VAYNQKFLCVLGALSGETFRINSPPHMAKGKPLPSGQIWNNGMVKNWNNGIVENWNNGIMEW